jgi:uncharacterized protein (DUF983 family)
MGGMSELRHPLKPSVVRGLKHRCPACGDGQLYGRYLKVQPVCEACGHELALYPADDGPAYLTIVLVGHLVIAPLLLFPIVWESSAWVSIPVLLASLSAIALTVLPRVKGGWIGLMYALGATSKEARFHTADAAD